MRYDAFISYSHAADQRLAPEVQSALHHLARPWYRRRALHVFRDSTSLAVTPALWPAIEKALRNARFFVYLASPDAARSEWVAREIDWWLTDRDAGTLLIVLTGGDLEWDDARSDFDVERSSAIPGVLHGAFRDEPRYLDLRWANHRDNVSLRVPAFRDAMATLAATLHGRAKEDLVGEDVRQHRRTMRVARTAAALLLTLTLAAATATVIATAQRNLALERQRLALSRQLAAEGTLTVIRSPNRLPLGLALAVEAFRLHPAAETERALRSLLSLRPQPVLEIASYGDVHHVALSPDGRRFVTGSAFPGEIAMWAVAAPDSPPAQRTDAPAPLWRIVTDAPVRGLALSPGGDRVIAGTGMIATVRSTETGDELLRLETGDSILTVDYHPAGSRIATAGNGGVVRLWSNADGRELGGYGHGRDYEAVQPALSRVAQDIGESFRAVRVVAFSPDGQWLASIDEDGVFCIARGLDAGDPLCRFTGGIGLHLAWAPDGRRVVTVAENVASIWALAGDGPITRVEHVDAAGDLPTAIFGWLWEAAFSPDGRWIATAGRDFSARVWDAATGREIARMRHASAVNAVRFSPDGASLATASEDGTVRVWDPLRGIERLRGTHEGGALTLAFDRTGRRLASGSRDGTATIWGLTGGDQVLTLFHQRPVESVAVSEDGSRIATLDNEGWIGVWSATGGARLTAIRPPGLRADRVAFAATNNEHLISWRSDDPYLLRPAAGGALEASRLLDRAASPAVIVGTRRVIAETDSGIVVFSTLSGDTLTRVHAPAFTGTASLSDDEQYLALESDAGVLRVLELPAGRDVTHLTLGSGAESASANIGGDETVPSRANGSNAAPRVDALDVASGGQFIAAVIDNTLRMWRRAEPGVVAIGIEQPDTSDLIAFTRSGRFLISIRWQGEEIVVRESDTGRIVSRLAHPATVDVVRSSQGGDFVATISDGRVRVWELETGYLALELGSETGYYSDVRFAQDDRYLVTAASNGEAVLRLWRGEDLLSAACSRLLAPLSREQWAVNLGNLPYDPACAR